MTDLADLNDAGAVAGPSDRPNFRDIAREEFWIVAKAFFAPIYGLFLVRKELSKLLRHADRNGADGQDTDPALTAAE